MKSLAHQHLVVAKLLERELGVHPKYRNAKSRPPESMWRDWEIYYKKRLDEELFKLAQRSPK